MNTISQHAAPPSRQNQRADSSRLPSTRFPPAVAAQPTGDSVRIEPDSNIHPRAVCLLKPRSEVAENYLRLRSAIEARRPPDRGIIVAVTSPGKGDGKTLTAINLAGSLAQNANARVLLVDLDLRQPGLKVHDYLGLKKRTRPDSVDGNEEPGPVTDQAPYHFKEHNLYLMLSSSGSESPYELLKSPRLDRYFQQASEEFDYIIVDTPQMLRIPDIELIGRVVDGFLIVIKADSTQQRTLEEALHLMKQEQVLGLVLNGITSPAPWH